MVRLLRGSELDGMTKGNIAMPAVKIVPASMTELATKATAVFRALAAPIASSAGDAEQGRQLQHGMAPVVD